MQLLLVLQVCRKEWCWVCGRDWQQHSNDTGGYYACNLAPMAAAAEADYEPEAGSSSNTQQQQQPQSSSGGVFGALKAFKSAMLDHKQRQYAAMHMSHEVNVRRLTVLLRYQQLLLAAVLQAWEFECTAADAVDAVEPAAAAAAAAVAGGANIAAGLKGLQREHQDEGQRRMMVTIADAAAAAATAATAAASELAVGRAGLPGARSVVSAVAAKVQTPSTSAAEQQQQQQQKVLLSSSNVAPVQLPQQQSQDGHQHLHQQQQQQLQQLLQQQGFQPLPEALLQQWLACVVQCKASLRWSCVRGFYLGSTASRWQLEHLTVSASLLGVYFSMVRVCRVSRLCQKCCRLCSGGSGWTVWCSARPACVGAVCTASTLARQRLGGNWNTSQ
jgi:hypothetical protein